MRIKSMTAVFGGLNQATLKLGPGLNLIEAPNEGGKSTWCAFWRAMLYGIDTRDRDKKGYLADKNHYQPWSGAPMAGEIDLEFEGRDITIRRGPRGNTPFGTFSAVYTGTQEPVPGLSASVCGELLTGVGQEVFTRSAFLGAGSMSVTAAPELERRIAALVTSGEEDVSYSQAMARLKEWKNRRQVNRSVGDIPRLEGELSQAEQELERLEEIAQQIARLEEERSALDRERDGLARQLEEQRRQAQGELDQRRAHAEEEYAAARRQLSALETERTAHPVPNREDLKGAQGELQYLKVLEEELRQGTSALEKAREKAAQARDAARDSLFSELSGEEAVTKAAADCAGYQAMLQKAGTPRAHLKRLFGLSLGSLIGWLLACLFLKELLSPFMLIGMVAGFALLTLISLLRGKKKREEAQAILARYGVTTPEELTAKAQDYQTRCQAADKAAHEVEVIRNAVAEREQKRDALKTGLLDFVHTFAPEAKDMFGCSAALSRALNLDHDLALARERTQERRRRLEDLSVQGVGGTDGETAAALAQADLQLEQVNARLNRARGTLQAMGDPAALAARREELENKLSRRKQELEAITLAMDVLTQANARLQERFSPALNAQAGQYLAKLTGNKYQAVSLTRELEGFVRERDGLLPRGALYLSRGTADQLYLAVRLAVCRLCLPEKPPIVLDDALSAFDDQRLARALALLYELAGEQQILLFTCQKREGETLAGAPGVTRIALG